MQGESGVSQRWWPEGIGMGSQHSAVSSQQSGCIRVNMDVCNVRKFLSTDRAEYHIVDSLKEGGWGVSTLL